MHCCLTDFFSRQDKGNLRRQTGSYFCVKRLVKRWLDRETWGRGLLWEAWGDVWGHRGSLWFVSPSITHILISFVVCEFNAPQQPVAVLPLCVTVWELCCAGGSPHSAPGRPRGRQLVYYGPRRGTGTGRRAWVWVNIWLLFCWGSFQKTAVAWNLKWLWAFCLFFLGIFIVPKLLSSLHLTTYYIFHQMLFFLSSTTTRHCTDTSAHCLQEVTALVRDAVDQRVKQYTESLHNRRQPKQKRELAPVPALFVKGNQW